MSHDRRQAIPIVRLCPLCRGCGKRWDEVMDVQFNERVCVACDGTGHIESPVAWRPSDAQEISQ